MIDRKARDAMLEAIQSFMDKRIESDKFDDTLNEIATTTQDQSVQAVKDALWSFYSDTEVHKIRVTKQGWDLLNRLRLILASDTEAKWSRSGPRWDIFKTFFALFLAGFGLVLLRSGFGVFFFMYWIFSSLMTYGLLWIWHRTDTKASKPNIPIFPFPSVRSLLSIRRKVRNFTRERYPKPLAREAECAGIEHRLKLIAYFPFYLLLGPITMLFLALPIRQQELRLNAPTDGMKPV